MTVTTQEALTIVSVLTHGEQKIDAELHHDLQHMEHVFVLRVPYNKYKLQTRTTDDNAS
jgi:hypothetical protein